MGNFYDIESSLAVAQTEAKKVLKDCICPVHKRKGRVSFDYDDLGCNAYIKCCCIQHAQQMTNAIKETEMFRKIEIENITHK